MPVRVIYKRYMKAFLNASEVAKLLSVHRATVARWIKKGLIQGVSKPEGTQNWRIPLGSYQHLTRKLDESHNL